MASSQAPQEPVSTATPANSGEAAEGVSFAASCQLTWRTQPNNSINDCLLAGLVLRHDHRLFEVPALEDARHELH